MIYVEGNGRKPSHFIPLLRRLHHQLASSKPMRILRTYLLILEGVNPGQQNNASELEMLTNIATNLDATALFWGKV